MDITKELIIPKIINGPKCLKDDVGEYKMIFETSCIFVKYTELIPGEIFDNINPCRIICTFVLDNNSYLRFYKMLLKCQESYYRSDLPDCFSDIYISRTYKSLEAIIRIKNVYPLNIPMQILDAKCGDDNLLMLEVEFSGEVEYHTINSKK